MGLSQQDVLGLLQQHGIKHECFEHAPVATCDAQAEALKGVSSGLITKNLFLRDKKRRQYLVTALPDTKVDLKVLSARLGCGKGGLSWGSEELLAESLQVDPGCVTPLALANASSKHVLLLVDAKLQAAGSPFFVHPIVNTASVLLDTPGLEAFLSAVGRRPVYADLEAEPKIDKDNPPDLKAHADSVEPPPKADDDAASSASSASNLAAAASQAGAAKQGGAAAPPGKQKSGGKGGKAAQQQQQQQQQLSADERHIQLTNVVRRTEELVDMVSRALLGKPTAEAGADGYVLRRLRADVQMELTALKNAAFTAGYNAGKGEVVAAATRQYA